MCWDTLQCHSPGNHRVKTVCENDKLRLQCRPKSILAIYSANYGRFLRGKPECDALNTGGPHIGMLEQFKPEMGPGAMQRVWHKYAVRLYLCPLAPAGWCLAGRGRQVCPWVHAPCLCRVLGSRCPAEGLQEVPPQEKLHRGC